MAPIRWGGADLLQAISCNGTTAQVGLLVEQGAIVVGADVHPRAGGEENDHITRRIHQLGANPTGDAVHSTARWGWTAKLHRFLQEGHADVDIVETSNGQTPLMAAALSTFDETEDIVRLLL